MTDPTKRNQTELILEHLEKHGTITPLEAQRLFGCMRLGARIWDLRHDGHNIVREMVIVPTRNGGTARVAQYRLAA